MSCEGNHRPMRRHPLSGSDYAEGEKKRFCLKKAWAMKQCGGNVVKAAKALVMSQATLCRRLMTLKTISHSGAAPLILFILPAILRLINFYHPD